ncbi:MAG: hypothetical protein OCD76_06750 [Reichenbachiella sp.]
MKYIIAFITINILLLNFVIAQKIEQNEIWYEGKVKFRSGSTVTGMLNYDNIFDQLKIKSDGKIAVGTSLKVESFELYDSSSRYQFYSLSPSALPSTDPSKGKKNTFFQVIYKNSSYLMLSKNYINYDDVSSYDPIAGTHHNYKVKKIVNTIYLMNKKGDLIPFLVSSNSQDLSFDILNQNPSNVAKATHKKKRNKNNRYKFVDEANIQVFLGNDYSDFMTYVNKNELDIRELPELISALTRKG